MSVEHELLLFESFGQLDSSDSFLRSLPLRAHVKEYPGELSKLSNCPDRYWALKNVNF